MVSRSYIAFKHVDCPYNYCRGREISLGHVKHCPFIDQKGARGDHDDSGSENGFSSPEDDYDSDDFDEYGYEKPDFPVDPWPAKTHSTTADTPAESHVDDRDDICDEGTKFGIPIVESTQNSKVPHTQDFTEKKTTVKVTISVPANGAQDEMLVAVTAPLERNEKLEFNISMKPGLGLQSGTNGNIASVSAATSKSAFETPYPAAVVPTEYLDCHRVSESKRKVWNNFLIKNKPASPGARPITFTPRNRFTHDSAMKYGAVNPFGRPRV